MSPRAMRRANARRTVREERRDALRARRLGLVAGAAVLGIAAPGADAATYTVTGNGDGVVAGCAGGGGSFTCNKLRDAIAASNANAGDDTIVLSGLSGTIRIVAANNPFTITPADSSGKLTITGPGAGALTISGDVNNNGNFESGTDSQIFKISATATDPAGSVSMSGLTLTRGYDPAAGLGGGAILDNDEAPLALTDMSVTNSRSDAPGPSFSSGGGGIAANGDLTLLRTTVTGNNATAGDGGGVSGFGNPGGGSTKYHVRITDSTISGNTSKDGGGGLAVAFSTLNLSNTHVTGNQVTSGLGGGVFAAGKYAQQIVGSVISGNTASSGGGGLLIATYGAIYTANSVRDTTISGNQSAHGAGIYAAFTERGTKVTIERSTLTGNTGGASSFGGGLLVGRSSHADVRLLDSTVSGNTATAGAGVSVGSDKNYAVFGSYNGSPVGSVAIDNSTIASNQAASHGGGVYLGQYDSGSPSVKKSASASITSSIISGNTAGGAAQDLDRVDTSTAGGFTSAFSLIGIPGDAPLSQSASLIGLDPKLGVLSDNGGPTLTMKPAGDSPVLDQGLAPHGLVVDQRGQPRTVETDLPDPAAGDGTDIGAVELDKASVIIPPAPAVTLAVSVRGVSISGAKPLLAAGSTPVSCALSTGTLASCVIEVRASSAISRGARSVAAGTLLAGGAVTSAGAPTVSTTLTLTKQGRAVLAKRPGGIDASVNAVGAGTSAKTATGTVHLVSGPSPTFRTGTRSAKLPSPVLAQLDTLAPFLGSAKTVSCTGYTDRTHKTTTDLRVSKAQAKAACARLVAKGAHGTVKVSGKGHSNSVASNRTAKGRAANRRVVVSFSF